MEFLSVFRSFVGNDTHNKCKDMDCSGCNTDEPEACSNKMIQIIIVVLVFIMAVW